MRSEKSSTRRSFLAASSGFIVVPRFVLGGKGFIPPSEKLNVAGVGVGGKGFSDLLNLQSENIVAICDVDWRLAARAFRRWPKAKRYKDYRVMLDKQKDIDAVVVSTPDHTHACISMEAVKRGKHVYTQKPLTKTVYEARKLTEAARKYKVATQMGNQGQASETTRRICETIWDGAIGKVYEVHIWTDRPLRGLFNIYWPQGVRERPSERPPVPKELDWNLWLGPSPERPYHPAYHPFRWRGWLDFGTGALGDIGCHVFDPVFRALKLGAPIWVQASSTLPNKETFPWASMVTYKFPARGDQPPVKLVWYDGGLRPPRPEELDEGEEMGTNGTLYIGTEGKMLGDKLIPAKRRKEYGEPPKILPRSPGHYKEWVIACKGGKKAGSNFDWAGPLTEVVLLGNIALEISLREKLTRYKLYWDPKAFKFTNLPEANRFLHREYRKGWTL